VNPQAEVLTLKAIAGDATVSVEDALARLKNLYASQEPPRESTG
jgi:hypothetical protein